MPPADETTAEIAARARRRRRRTMVFAGLILVSLGLMGIMGVILERRLQEYDTATADNVPFSLAQSEVEFLRFQVALAEAAEDPSRVSDVRRRFDIFYSRVTSFEGGMVFQILHQTPQFTERLAAVQGFLERAVPLIDSDDDSLAAGLPALTRDAAEVGPDVRALALSGISTFSQMSDAGRAELHLTLRAMGFVLAGIFLGFAGLAIMLQRQIRLAEHSAEKLRRTGARLRTIVETSLDAIVVCDAAGRVIEVNDAAASVFGITPGDVGKSFIDLFFPADDHAALRAGPLSFLAEGRPPARRERRFERCAKAASGRRVPAEFSIDSATTESGMTYVAFVRDISRRAQAEEALREARDRAVAGEKAKDQFLAVMSHEMRTPLNGLLGTAELLSDTPLEPRQAAYLETLKRSGRQLLTLVNDVLDLSKFVSGETQADLKPMRISALLDNIVETLHSLALANGNTLNWRWIGPPVDEVWSDPRQLRQILLNLVGNANKFTRDGRVDIEVEMSDSAAPMAEFRVIDTGIGIAEEDLDTIFDDFRTLDSSYGRQTEGTGLGLGIAKRLAEILGGEIGVESEPGEGSLFWVRIPVRPAETQGAETPAEQSLPLPKAPRPLSVLLVEDNEVNRLVARSMIEAAGHRVTEAVDGRAGVDAAAATRFDVILMDISMPQMDGQQATRAIRASDGASKLAPIIALTAHALPEEVARFRAAGIDFCLSKPIERGVLIEILRRVAAGERLAPEQPAPARDGPPLLLTGHLDELIEGLSPTGALSLLDRVVAEIDTTVPALAEGQDTDPATMAARAHKAAGSCATFGLEAMRSALIAIEAGIKSGTPPGRKERARLVPLWAETRAALAAWRETADMPAQAPAPGSHPTANEAAQGR